MAIGQLQSWLFDSFFEARFHAYVELSYYFMAFCLFNLILGFWSFFYINTHAIGQLSPSNQDTCGVLNTFFKVFTVLSFSEIFVSALVALTIGLIMRKGCAYIGLGSLGLFGLSMLAKGATLVMGALWIFNQPNTVCQDLVPSLYGHAVLFLFVVSSVYAFQVFCGSWILVSFGVGQAIKEGLWRINEQGKKEEDANYYQEPNEAEETTVNTALLKGSDQDSQAC